MPVYFASGPKDGRPSGSRYIPPRRERDRSPRRGRKRIAWRLAVAAFTLGAVALVALMLIYRRGEPAYSDEQRACISQRYKQFNPKNLTQCLDICKACMKGNTVTCNTSCKLKGAS
jgi:hypothetical protein